MPTASHQALAPARLLSLAIATTLLAPMAHAEFIADSTASLTTSNMYLNRDFRENAGQNKREEWGQGFLLDLKSGYTEGTVGFGLDAMGMLHDLILPKGAQLVGFWPNSADYSFTASKALTADGEFFVGLALDEEGQYSDSDRRIQQWAEQLKEELAALGPN